MNVPETFFSTSEELVLFGLSCLCGAAMGVFYDVFRAFRLMLRHSTALVFIEDIIFLLGCGILINTFAQAAARGELRFYYFIGSALGFTVYFFTVGSVVILTLRKLITLTKRIIKLLLMPFRTPFAFLCRKVREKFGGSTEILKKSKKVFKMLLLNPLTLLYNKIENKLGKNVKNVAKNKKEKQ